MKQPKWQAQVELAIWKLAFVKARLCFVSFEPAVLFQRPESAEASYFPVNAAPEFRVFRVAVRSVPRKRIHFRKPYSVIREASAQTDCARDVTLSSIP